MVLGLKTQQDVSWWETTFTLRTHLQVLSNHAQAHTALAGYAQYPCEDKILLTRIDDPLSSTCSGTMVPSLTKDFKFIIFSEYFIEIFRIIKRILLFYFGNSKSLQKIQLPSRVLIFSNFFDKTVVQKEIYL